ncbi:MAG: ATP-binding protein [Bdellovibrionaceae bacterium]|nr:ATP-binding protein [Pseudobdellovibrionaceae bacterium]
MSNEAQSVAEVSRRKREIFTLIPLIVLFVGLTWFQFQLFSISEKLPFHYAIFFFGLVNLNLLIFLALIYLIFRNLVKVYTESKIPLFGKSLRSKLMVAFFTFAFVPTFLMFLVSIFYINSSFDRWFALKGMGILDDSIQVTELYYQNLKKESYFLANQVAEKTTKVPLSAATKKNLESLMQNAQVDFLEVYDFTTKQRWIAQSNAFSADVASVVLPPIPWEELEALYSEDGDFSVSLDLNEGEDETQKGRLLRSIRSIPEKQKVVVVNRLIPFFLVEQINNLIEARDEYRQLTPFEFPLKSIYLITLVLMTMVILLGGTWFGLYLAGQLSKSLESLSRATREIAKGRYRTISIADSGSYEIDHLVSNFNQMAQTIEKSRHEIEDTNQSLQKTLHQLEESSDNIKAVIEHISTAVIYVDKDEVVTLINKKAEDLLSFSTKDLVGHKLAEVLSSILYNMFVRLKERLVHEGLSFVSAEEKLEFPSRSIRLKCTVSCLYHDDGTVRGYVLAGDDISLIAKAQRAEAWTEVATRVAHEIKNPLTPIKLSAERLQRKFSEQITDPAFVESIKMINQQVDIVKNLVNEFSYHARLPQLTLEKGSINDLVRENLWVYRHRIKGLSIDLDVDESLPSFYFDHDQLKRIIINLLDNAVDALEGTSDPRIRVQTRSLKDSELVQVTISDNGVGIPVEMVKKVFEPNYTTKSTGTGLGLSIVKKMIEEHSGRIYVQRSGEWTEFVFEIPLQPQDGERNKK